MPYYEKNQEKSIAILKELVAKYPKEKEAHLALGIIYWDSDPDKAIEEHNIALSLDPERNLCPERPRIYLYEAERIHQGPGVFPKTDAAAAGEPQCRMTPWPNAISAPGWSQRPKPPSGN